MLRKLLRFIDRHAEPIGICMILAGVMLLYMTFLQAMLP